LKKKGKLFAREREKRNKGVSDAKNSWREFEGKL
jgi:hypothetical protein